MEILQQFNTIISTLAYLLIVILVLKFLFVRDPPWPFVNSEGNITDRREDTFKIVGDTAAIPHSPKTASLEKYIDYMACAMRFQAEISRAILVETIRQRKRLEEKGKS